MQTNDEQQNRRDQDRAASSSHVMEYIQMLDTIKAYVQKQQWPRLSIDGQEVVPAGRAEWLRFLWLEGKKDQHLRVYRHIITMTRS